MCIVVDTNQAGALVKREKPYIKVFWDWLQAGGKIVSGGKLEQELYKHSQMRDLLTQLSRSGQIKRISTQRIDARANEINAQCRSNDSHVIALALEANSAVIMTEDKN